METSLVIDFARLNDKAVMITGAADGIGLALAEAFVSSGARVFMSDIAAEKLQKQAARLGCASAVCDVTDPDAAEAAVSQAAEEIGPLDLLCSNAGVFIPGSLLDTPPEDIAFQFDVNVWGMLNVSRPFVRELRKTRRPGHILMTGSEHSLSTPDYLSAFPTRIYNMTKHCVLAMADGLRLELAAEEIGVSVLCPGPVASGLTDNSSEFRPARYVGADGEKSAAVNLLDSVDEEHLKQIESLYQSAPQAAATAIEGLRRGLFVIPTHAYLLADATARYREIERGFEVLESQS
jgi:NAD(P)-dependent dehydrogenase (short-subunit alcohol dehydrogenase family)